MKILLIIPVYSPCQLERHLRVISTKGKYKVYQICTRIVQKITATFSVVEKYSFNRLHQCSVLETQKRLAANKESKAT